ncbi:MAG: protein-glutamine glutaminase family protein [Thermoanaerobaculia bacterium]
MARMQEKELLTVAAIRKPRRGVTEYLFNEKQQIFTFRSKTRTAEVGTRRLNEAFKEKIPVKARLDPVKGFIKHIARPTNKDFERFERERILLDEPEKTRPIKVAKIDPVTFNIVDHYLKVPVFLRCTRIVPSYRSAVNIFNFCAAQSCHLPGPYTITPCIPFQYVRDGCYARAHKMRWIITQRFRYCCEKVFSFANQGNDRLAVRADKWGGCCVTWWYHVAPLVRVRIKIPRLGFNAVLAMVIDPGMFNKPVMLSSWLAAQENTVCDADANVSMYSIQPGSAYAPANYAGTAFSTDPAYTATNATLTAYRHLVTCP